MFTPAELRQAKIFACLSEHECAQLAQTVADVRLKAGEWLLREGETPWFYVVFEGRLRIVKDILGRQTELDEYDFKEGDFLGEVPLLLGAPAFASARAQTPCRLARLDRQQFHHLIRDSKEASAIILQTLNERLMRVQQRTISLPTSRVLIFGRDRDADCHYIRAFLSANRISYEWVDRDREPERVPSGVSEDPDCPAVTVDKQLFSEPPTTRELAEALQLQTKPNSDSYDVVIVGAGPAGMAAGVYGTSEGLTALIVERWAAGGQAGTSTRIENYLGFPEGISGEDLTGRGFKQATRFGAELRLRAPLKSLPAAMEAMCAISMGARLCRPAPWCWPQAWTGVGWR